MTDAEIAAVKSRRMALIVFRFAEGNVGAEATVVLDALADELATASSRRLDHTTSRRPERLS